MVLVIAWPAWDSCLHVCVDRLIHVAVDINVAAVACVHAWAGVDVPAPAESSQAHHQSRTLATTASMTSLTGSASAGNLHSVYTSTGPSPVGSPARIRAEDVARWIATATPQERAAIGIAGTGGEEKSDRVFFPPTDARWTRGVTSSPCVLFCVHIIEMRTVCRGVVQRGWPVYELLPVSGLFPVVLAQKLEVLCQRSLSIQVALLVLPPMPGRKSDNTTQRLASGLVQCATSRRFVCLHLCVPV